MKTYSEVIIKPVLTEKSYKLQSNQNIYTFQVSKKASKTFIKEAIQKLFEVKVVDVNIVNTKPKKKRVGLYTGKTQATRKAYVKLMPGQSIGQQPTDDTKNKK